MEYGGGGLPPAVASIITHSWRNGNKNIQKNMESWWRPTRGAAGSLNPHPGLRPGWARCPPLAGSLARRSFSVHGHLAQGISSAYFTKKKTDCLCSPFLFGGDTRAMRGGESEPTPRPSAGLGKMPSARGLAGEEKFLCSRASCTEILVPLISTRQKRHCMCSAFCWWR